MTARIAEPIRFVLSLDSGDDDHYRWALTHWHGIAAVLYATEGDIPEDWRYYTSQSRQDVSFEGIWPDLEYFDLYASSEITHEDLRHAGYVLDRYLRRYKHLSPEFADY